MYKGAILNGLDYRRILKLYNQPIPPKTSKHNFKQAENATKKLLGKKFCSCVSSISRKNKNKNKSKSNQNTSKAIAICSSTIFNRKGLQRQKFTCKKRQTVDFIKKI
jgi:hypothetical protein